MTASRPSQLAIRAIIDAIPNSEESLAMLFALKSIIELGEHLIGPLHVRAEHRARADHDGDGDREQGGIETVPGDVDGVDGEMMLVHPMVAQGIAAEG